MGPPTPSPATRPPRPPRRPGRPRAGRPRPRPATARGAPPGPRPGPGPAPELGELVLRQSDFPAGWTSEPAEDDDDEAQGEMERCLGIERSGDRPEATSPRFTVGDAITQASSAVELAPDAATVDREFAAIDGPRFLDCAAQQLDRTIARESAGVEFAPATAERLPFRSFGDGTSAVRMSTAVRAGDQQVPIYADLVFVRKGLAELSFSFINAGEPFAAALATELVGKVVARA
ncbi:MAG TPA: hypothetical protein VM263_09060 [Acidimicrobiales bacterium]|nr:hypothetical protein [Acidimicrobiales bacterium]